ncbi:hypothetical protein WJX81_000444 [Elliptochloris bilobata]|uniref:Uncharacterized protein n=1 Tax=Elliptochloris bilobata TaxID=381761 RepID=A0AAW1SI43_9CHLO
MDCRHISEEQVRAALQTGSINHRKSDPRLLPCPKLVVDALVGKSVQAVFSACPTRTGVVTVIDKDTNWACYCPS